MRLDTQLTDEAAFWAVARARPRPRSTSCAMRRVSQLFVVFVHTFDGINAQRWTDDTAARSGLGDRDGLLAVATHAREFAYSFPQNFPLSDAQLAAVASTAIEPALAQNDWAGAVVGASNGYAAALAGQPIPAPAIQPGQPDPDRGGAGSGALIGGPGRRGVVVRRPRRVRVLRGRRRPARPRAPAGPSPAADRPAAGPGQHPADRARQRAPVQRAGARDRPGSVRRAEATAAFTAALDSARAEVAEAFRLRIP